MKATIAMLAGLLVVGCAPVERGQCLQAERYTYLNPILVGFTNGVPNYMWLPAEGTRCVRWEFPEGRSAPS